MVATFTPQPELQKFAYDLSKNVLLPAAQFKGVVHYEGRLQVRIDPTTRAISMEPLDDTWAGTTIAENDLFAVEGGGRAVHGCWQLRTVIAGEERNVDPIDPSPEILASLPWAVSSDPIYPNRLRGVLDQVVDVRLSDTIFFGSNNHRSRGTLGVSAQNASDSLRQLTFAGAVSGDWRVGSVATGGGSGAVGVVVGLSPGISQEGVGHYVIVDMGVDYAGAEWTLGEAVSTPEGSGTLDAGALGARSISPLFRQPGIFDDFVPAGAAGTLIGNMSGTPTGTVTVQFGAAGTGDNKVLFNPTWKIPATLGDYAKFTGTANGNDGLYGPIIGFEDGGPSQDNVAVFADDFPNPDSTNQAGVTLELYTNLTERTLITLAHAADIPIAGDPGGSVDLNSPVESWNALGVYDNDTIEIIEASPAFTSGSRPFGLFRVHEIPVIDRITVFPTFSPSTQFDTGTITVYRRRPASE